MELEPIDPQKAVELYLTDREPELRETTLKSHRSRLRYLVEWCDQEGITNLNELTGRRLHEFRIWRRNEGDLAPPTERTQMATIRVFLRWLGTIDGVDPDLHHKVRVPKYAKGEHSRDAVIDSETAEQMLAYLGTYEYASRDHVVISLLWHTMIRRGGIRALDLEDYNREEQFLALVHRPDTGTQLKNGTSGERLVALSDEICMVLDDYIRAIRIDITDDYGREPLVTTTHGRISNSTIAKASYGWSRPCTVGQDCPHGRDIEDCEALDRGKASKCPSSEGPHAFRRGGITHYLSSDVPQAAVSNRANVSPDVLEEHYDERTAKEKMEQRRKYLDNI
jgi:site-specific recombinase XerD